ncbi:related to MIM1 |uniref:Related to MIM1 \|nr:related to MIM1 \
MSSHEEKHAPRTDANGDAEAMPTVSATGMPRFIHRHKDARPSSEQQDIDDKDGSAPSELQAAHDSDELDSDNDQDEQEAAKPNYPPTGSLTLAAFNPYSSIPLSRRLALISGSVFINLGLPFLNGVMLGFGEIFARVVVAPTLGITGVGWAGDTARAVANWNWGRTTTSPSTMRQESYFDARRSQQTQPGDFDDWSATADARTGSAHIEL